MNIYNLLFIPILLLFIVGPQFCDFSLFDSLNDLDLQIDEKVLDDDDEYDNESDTDVEGLLESLDDATLSLDELPDINLVESFDLDNFVDLDDLQIFEMFKKVFKKSYDTVVDEQKALKNFLFNKQSIQTHNLNFFAGTESFSRGIWEYSDWLVNELNELLNGFRRPVMAKSLPDDIKNMRNLPKSINWTAKGYVTPVQAQGLCASCWSFSATGSIEGQIYKNTKTLTKLSEQNLVDCNKDADAGNWGCKGGDMETAFSYVINKKGINSAARYPYKAVDVLKCKNSKKNSVATIKSFSLIETGNETLLMNAVATIGPLSIAIYGSLESFQSYKSGVYYDDACTTNINHAVLLVGYGVTNNGVEYWIIKNSYGITWGERGYMRLARNRKNHCGVAEFIIYPIV
ncbi:unnamed protein product [Diamesa tonsa]